MSVESVEFVKGPLVTEMSRAAAEKGLRRHAAIVAGAPYSMDSVEGRWIAAIVHEAESDLGGPADQFEQTPGPKSEGPDDTTPVDNDDLENNDGPESDSVEDPDQLGDDDHEHEDKHDHKDGKEDKELSKVMDMLKTICDALGIPSLDSGGPAELPSEPPLGPGGPDNLPPPPPPTGPAHGNDDSQRIIHEKALKPGEVPPGGTPIGAPAFSHVREDHPWKRTAGVVASFATESPIGDRPLADIHAELTSLASELGGGYKVKSLNEDVDSQGNRIAHAVISVH